MSALPLYRYRTTWRAVLSSLVVGLMGVGLLGISNAFDLHPNYQAILRSVGGLFVATMTLRILWDLAAKRSFLSELMAVAQLAEDIQVASNVLSLLRKIEKPGLSDRLRSTLDVRDQLRRRHYVTSKNGRVFAEMKNVSSNAFKSPWLAALRLNREGPKELRRKDLSFIDIETTGSIFGFHEIIELAAIRISPDLSTVVDTWHCRFLPNYPERLSREAAALNGFDEQFWREALKPTTKVWTNFAAFAKGCVPVCHNPSFERGFITLSASQHGVADLGLDYHWIGTESLAWPFFLSGQLRQLSLESLCEFFAMRTEPHPHTAMEGAKSCLAVYRSLIERYAESGVQLENAQRAVR